MKIFMARWRHRTVQGQNMTLELWQCQLSEEEGALERHHHLVKVVIKMIVDRGFQHGCHPNWQEADKEVLKLEKIEQVVVSRPGCPHVVAQPLRPPSKVTVELMVELPSLLGETPCGQERLPAATNLSAPIKFTENLFHAIRRCILWRMLKQVLGTSKDITSPVCERCVWAKIFQLWMHLRGAT